MKYTSVTTDNTKVVTFDSWFLKFKYTKEIKPKEEKKGGNEE
ncbi:hypothetical protein [Priestia megaterium]|nr:hypothetical protein [Priestia megaterium]MDF2010181.1 hypothetical protein [Priestia megaterium]